MFKPRLFLIDATAFCYRAFYALPKLSNSFGQPTGAIYGFVNMLKKVLKNDNPEYLGVCFDVSRDTFRARKFKEYKMQRPAMPDDLSQQLPLIKKIVLSYGISIFEKEGFEADDIIATLTKKAKDKGFITVIVSSDKDILQLVDEDTFVYSPYKDEGTLYDAQKVFGRFGVHPQRIADIITLMGDNVDNIPGVSGIGEKTAMNLIKDFGSLDNLLGNIDKIKQEKIAFAIKNELEKISLNRELIKLDSAVEIGFDLEQLKIKPPKIKELFVLFKSLELKKFLKDLNMQEKVEIETEAGVNEEECVILEDADVPNVLSGIEELILYYAAEGGLFFYVKGKIFALTGFGDRIRQVLANADIKKIGYDLKKIKVSLSKDNVFLEGLFFDPMLAAYLIDPAKPNYSLTELVWEYLGKQVSGEGMSPKKAIVSVSRLIPVLDKELAKRSLAGLFREIEMPLAGVLAEMEISGIRLDINLLKKISLEVAVKLTGLVEDIYTVAGGQFNINSPKQLRGILFDKLKLPILRKTKTGPSTDEEVLKGLSHKHKLPAFLLEYRQLTKLKNTYIDALPELADKNTGRIHTYFNQTGTETGRLSSSNPNLQNLPVKTEIGRNIRKAITAGSESGCLLSCDYSQVELRILAHLSGDGNLIQAFKENKDVHKFTASLIYGISESEITEEMRNAAKRVNFGIVYGLSPYGLSKDLGISVETAGEFIDAYFLRYPQVKDYVAKQILKAEQEGFVTTLSGRRRYLPQINSDNQAIRQFAQRQAVNTPIQGSASDLIKSAMVALQREMKERRVKTKLILQIHDELVFDVSAGELEEVSKLAKERMENALELAVPIKVEIKKGLNWLEMEDLK